MFTACTLTLNTALIATLSFGPQLLRAQELTQNTGVPDAGASGLMLRQDLLEPDMFTPATRRTKDPFVRTVAQRADGLYAVQITDALGLRRMEGTYKDSELLVPHGTFQYFHANGRMESTGEYIDGRKCGIWHCASASGQPRADRNYHGLAWDDLQVAVGLATRAN